MKIASSAYLDYANYDVSTGIRTAVAEFLRELDRRGVEFRDGYTLLELAAEVKVATGQNLVNEED